MANSKTVTAKHTQYFYVTMTITDTNDDSANQRSKLEWRVDLTHYSLSTSSSITITVKVDGTNYSYTHAAINCGNTKHTTKLCGGSAWISHSSSKSVNFSFTTKFGSSGWTINGKKCTSLSGSGTITLPQLAVSPTLPTRYDVGGFRENWIDIADPKFHIDWSGASAGTYTISEYNVQVTKLNDNTWTTEKTYSTSSTSGSDNAVPITHTSLTTGMKLQTRLGMKTTNGTHWGYVTSSSVLTVMSKPQTPPRTDNFTTEF